MKCPKCGTVYAVVREDDGETATYARDLCKCEKDRTCQQPGCKLEEAQIAILCEDGSVDRYLCIQHGPMELFEHAGPSETTEKPSFKKALEEVGPAPEGILATSHGHKTEGEHFTDEQIRKDAKEHDFKNRCLNCDHVHWNSERTYKRTNLRVMTGCPKCGNPSWELVEEEPTRKKKR